MLMAAHLMASHARVSFSAQGNLKIKVRVNGELINDYPARFVDIPHAYEGFHNVTVRVFDHYGFRYAHKQRIFFKRGARNRFRLGQDAYGYPILRRARGQRGVGVSYYYHPGDNYSFRYGAGNNTWRYGRRYGRGYGYSYGRGWNNGKNYGYYGEGNGRRFNRGNGNRRHYGGYEAEKDVDKHKGGKQKQNTDYQSN